MERGGKDARSIKLATGWERGKDGKWRHEERDFDVNAETLLGDHRAQEIRDKINTLMKEDYELDRLKSRVSVKLSAIESVPRRKRTAEQRSEYDRLYDEWDRLSELESKNREKRYALQESLRQIRVGGSWRLGEVISDERQFAAYPELRDYTVNFTLHGMDDNYLGNFDAERKAIDLNKLQLDTEEKIARTLAHEVQHAIQHIEGFARGGNVEEFELARENNKRLFRDVTQMFDKLGYQSWIKAMGEDDLDAVDRWNRQNPGKNFGLTHVFVDRGLRGEVSDERLAELHQFLDNADKVIKENQSIFGNARFATPREAYHRLAGEVEARNVSERMNMTDEQRRQSLAADTEDVARDEQIVRFGNGVSMSEGDINDAISRAKRDAERMPNPIEFTKENWDKAFPAGKVTTPIGEVSLGAHQFEKMQSKGRTAEVGLMKATLERPDFVIEENAPNESAERQSNYLFVKTFVKDDGTTYRHYESVTISRDGGEVVVSSHYISENKLRSVLKDGNLIYKKEDSQSSNGSEMRLAETQSGRSDLLPTPDDNESYSGKVSENSADGQADGGETTNFRVRGGHEAAVEEARRRLESDDASEFERQAARAVIKAYGGGSDDAPDTPGGGVRFRTRDDADMLVDMAKHNNEVARQRRDAVTDFVKAITDVDELTDSKFATALGKVMRGQRQYDQATVADITTMVKAMMDAGLLTELDNFSVKQILTKVKDSTGKNDITAEANKLIDIMLKHQLRRGKRAFEQQLKVKGMRQDSRGVVVQNIKDY